MARKPQLKQWYYDNYYGRDDGVEECTEDCTTTLVIKDKHERTMNILFGLVPVLDLCSYIVSNS